MKMLDEKNNFEKALKYVLVNEGGAKFTQTKFDRGGATRWGITQATLSRFLGRPATVQEVKELSEDDASLIYWEYYWLPMGLPGIERNSIATCLFDMGVVRGIGVPPKYAQEICNKFGAKLVVDGQIGPKTIKALNEIDEQTFVYGFSHRAEQGFKAIAAKNPTQEKFLKGWLNRAKKLRNLV